ncbi:MAG: hypothetical protein L0387_09120, partial [Acidobacteria bacterium]|nr:hypothetical protein [Acidobacteriota bacterium]
VVFQLTNDIIPERKPDLTIPAMSVRMEPVLKYRGLHIRHFVMPWMGMDYFRKFLDQQAKMKCNYLEFYWYVGDPWTEYSYRGEKRLIGDIYTKESGYVTWRINTGTFTTADVKIGKEHFNEKRACAPEFQDCETPEEAHRVARQLLKQVIAYAHQRKIQVWLGAGDCPGTPPNLGRHAKYGQTTSFGRIVSPGDPVGIEIWKAALRSMVETYSEADGFWVWLAEGYFHSEDPEAKKTISQYEEYKRLIPPLQELRKMGYDQYFRGMSQEKQIESDIGLLHYGKSLSDFFRKEFPSSRLGIALLGRSYLFPAMDKMFPREVPFESMEASICWNRKSRVPMENFGGMQGRELLLVPRLDDDESEFGMQFNVTLYEHDRVISGSVTQGLSGVAPQTGKLRGLEQNARFVAEGGWDSSITLEKFYQSYVRRIYGTNAADLMTKAYRTLEANEMFMGLQAEFKEAHFFLGLHNFLNYADTRDIRMMGAFRRQSNPFEGPELPRWNVKQKIPSPYIEECAYRSDRMRQAIGNLGRALALLEQSRAQVLPGAREELEYLVFKTETYILHLRMTAAMLDSFISYDEAFRAKGRGDEQGMLGGLERSEFLFTQARRLAQETAGQIAKRTTDPTELYILFRYNVRFILPLEEFSKFLRNVVNFHHGQPYWEKVNWDIVALRDIS